MKANPQSAPKPDVVQPTREERLAARERTRQRMDREAAGARKKNAERAQRPADEYDYADKIVALMAKRGVSQMALMHLTGDEIHQTRISRWRRRIGEPNLEQTEILARCLQVPFDYFRPSRTEPPDLKKLADESQLEEVIRRIGVSAALDRILMRPTIEVHSVRPTEAGRTYGEEEAMRPRPR